MEANLYNPNIPIVVTDIETGGLDLDHPIIQIAAIVYLPKTGETLESFECKVEFDEEDCDAEALRINRYSPELWDDSIPLKEALQRLSQVFKRHATSSRTSKKGFRYQVAVAAGYNSHFDRDRLFHRAKQFDIFLPVDPRFLDVMQLALWKLRLDAYKLTDVAKYFELDTTNAHDALADVRLTIDCMEALLNHD
jgi:DNA polymerase III epsilon subunit-like protein